MAFQQPRRPPARPLSYTSPPPVAESSQRQTSPQRLESEEWVLFSPSAAGSTGCTHTTSTERTPRTAGLSRLSDFGSLDTAARSEQLDDLDDDVTSDDAEAELDSLDDGLHAFHEPSQPRDSSQTVFPTHDGFGTFPTSAVQDQMMQFEASAKKQPRRRSSVQRRLDALDDADGLEQDERRQRIETWRLEQSRALLEEIERETRRRRRTSRASLAKTDAHQHPAEDASFWRRFTKKIIRDLMGIDENLLSVIFGESLPAEATSGSSDWTASSEVRHAPDMAETWEHRLLDRVARELGILVHQLSEHPGAFSTHLRTQDAARSAPAGPGPQTAARRPSDVSTAAESSAAPSATQSTPNIQFQPTLPPHTTTYSEASLWGIEEEPEPPFAYMSAAQRDRDYWERDLDVKMVFNFLKDRFSSRPPSPEGSVHLLRPPRRPSSSSPACRRALIRHHHPLVSRNLHHTNTTTMTVPIASSSAADGGAPSPSSAAAVAPMSRKNLRRFDNAASGRRSSCASQSTRRSRKSGSSRNYWDLGGSVGSAGPAGGVGVVAGVTMGEV